MKPLPQAAETRRSLSRGFSTVEVVLSLTVILVLAAIASPVVVKALRTYQLSDKATRLAGLIKLTRFEAIRTNTKVKAGFQQVGGQWTVWKDSIANGAIDGNEVREVFGGSADLLAAAPNPAAIAATIGGGGTLNLSVVSGTTGFITFDARGACDFPGAPVVYVFYLGSATDAQAGYRAVLVMPSGTTQVWTSSAAGDWQRTS
jgi:Tfp pilus assembly protein FimT